MIECRPGTIKSPRGFMKYPTGKTDSQGGFKPETEPEKNTNE